MSSDDTNRDGPGNAERTDGMDGTGDTEDGAGDVGDGTGDVGNGAGGGGDGAELLELLALLADPTARRLLAYIAYDNPEDVEDIPTHTGAARHLDEEAVEELLESLRRDHLPALESTGIIDWDRENDVVTRGERFDEIWPVLRLMITHREELPEEWLSFPDTGVPDEFGTLDEFGAARDEETDTGDDEDRDGRA